MLAGWLCLALPAGAAAQAGSEAETVTEAEAAGQTPAQAVPASVEAPPLTRLEARIELERLLIDQEFEAAVEAGLRLVELTEQEFGSESREGAEAHQRLGDAQQRAAQHEDAAVSYLRAIDLYRANDGPFAESLIEPTVSLGDNYHADEQYLNAVGAYDEARTIQRRIFGLLSEEQIFVLDKLTESFEEMGMGAEANDQQLTALMLIERRYPEASVEVLEAIYRYARWLRSVFRFTEERLQYERAIRIIRENYGKDSILLVTPYRELGNSFRVNAFEQPRGASALQSALELIEQQEEVDELTRAQVLLDIGDWKTAFGAVDGGAAEYLQAWQALDVVENGDEFQQSWFGGRRPIFVLTQRMSDRGLSQAPEAMDGRVIVRFDIDARGRPANAAVLESDPPGFKDEAALRAIRQSRFRPKIIDGEIVLARNFGVEFTYSYLPATLEESETSG